MKSTLAMMLCAAVLLGGCASSQKAAGDQQTNAEEKSSQKDYDKLIKDAKEYEGYFDLYQKDGELYLSVPKEQLNKPFLMNFELARGVGSSGLYGGTMLNIFEGLLVSLQKHEGKIFLVQHPHRYTATAGTPEAKAVDDVPNRRAHCEPKAEGGAMTTAPGCSFGMSSGVTWIVSGSA